MRLKFKEGNQGFFVEASIDGFWKRDKPCAVGHGPMKRRLGWLVLVFGFCCQNPCLSQGSQPIFVEQAKDLGVHFVHYNGMSGRFFYPEINGSGGALFDFDRDGDLDILICQGAPLGPEQSTSPWGAVPKGALPLGDRLFRNDLLPNGGGRLSFTDITSQSGLPRGEAGFGVAVGDIDNDGFPDLYLTKFGTNRMLRNLGDGRFEDVTEKTGTGDPRWSMSATFLDIDGDGWQDLYVTNYVQYGFENHKNCLSATGQQDYCGPNSYSDDSDRLYRNRGDGSFEDISLRAGIARVKASGMGVVAEDFNGDGRPDLYVANDADANQLWVNQGGGRFLDDGLLAGCALDANGQTEAGMGVHVGDGDGDGRDDLIVTHLTGETHTFYQGDGKGNFEDQTVRAGLAIPTLDATGWGVVWLDYDNDGLLDLFVANGAVTALEHLSQAGDPFPFHQTNQLFRNMGNGSFAEVSTQAGAALALSEVSRGVAVGDLDNDGDSDLLVVNNNGPARILMNQVGASHSWLGFSLFKGRGKDYGDGAVVCLQFADGKQRCGTVRRNGSYLSSNDPRVLFGLKGVSSVARVIVTWPDGSRETFAAPVLKTYNTLVRGQGLNKL